LTREKKPKNQNQGRSSSSNRAASVVVNRASYFSSALKNPKKHTRPPLSCVDIVGENVVKRERKAPNPSTRRLRRIPSLEKTTRVRRIDP
jgi:hypothetical protein